MYQVNQLNITILLMKIAQTVLYLINNIQKQANFRIAGPHIENTHSVLALVLLVLNNPSKYLKSVIACVTSKQTRFAVRLLFQAILDVARVSILLILCLRRSDHGTL